MTNKETVLPLFRWSGGKRSEIDLFRQFYPENFSTYVEPFFGAGAVFFDLQFAGNNIISDIHPESINYLKEIQKGNGRKIYDMLKEARNEEDYYYYIRDDFEIKDDTDSAFRFIYLRKTCYRGMLRYNKKGGFNIPFGRSKSFTFEEILDPKYFELLSRTTILNEDFRTVMAKTESPESFVFLDPPYDSVFTDYGYCTFGRKDHEDLANIFKSTKSKCLLIIGGTPLIQELYEPYIIGSYSKKYAFKIHSGRVSSEIDKEHLVIKNY